MLKRRLFVLLAVIVALVAVPRPAAADITAFLGVNTSPASRSAKGFAVGFGLVIVGFEFEYSSTSEDDQQQAPALRTGMFNVLLQTPIDLMHTQFYLTAGGGLYRETLGVAQETSFGTNLGGGAKIRLAGPIRARLDYRLFRLRGSPFYPSVNRFYAGLNVSF